MNRFTLPCDLSVPAPSVIAERQEWKNGTYHSHTLECQIGTLGDACPVPLAWNDPRRAIRLTWSESGCGELFQSLRVEAHAHTGDPDRLREIACHLEAVNAAWNGLRSLAGEPTTAEGFLARVCLLFGAEEVSLLCRDAEGVTGCEMFGSVEDGCAYVRKVEFSFRAKALPDPFVEEEAA